MRPLADEIRPQTLDQVAGQKHLLGPGALLRRLIEGGTSANMIFYGPSGTGKTTIASIIAKRTEKALYHLNATTASLQDVKAIIADVDTMLAPNGVLLYLDEIQYFNKKQQQSLLEFMENGKITLIASTTENPYFYVYNALLSRSTVFEFKTLTAEETVTLGPGGLPVEPDILAAVAPGQEILLDDGLMALRAETCGRAVTCTVTRGGVLESRKSITLPGVELLRPALTAQDLLDLDAAAGQGVTAVMQPFVRSRRELEQVRAALARRGLEHLTIFAKIEDRQGWQSLPQWMDACDVVTVARGDLGSNLGLLHLPAAQKDIAARCRRAGRSFLVVTQLLHTMTEHPTPTRAEVLDVYNAVLDGASALMLTGETARGRYPVQAVRWLLDIARQAE